MQIPVASVSIFLPLSPNFVTIPGKVTPLTTLVAPQTGIKTLSSASCPGSGIGTPYPPI